MKIKKVVIPIAGLGKRMLPITKVIPKELLPLIDKPLIQYAIHECINSGLKNIIFVTNYKKYLIKNYIENIFLKKKCNFQKKLNIDYIYQKSVNGLGNAILSALPKIGYKSFAVILPDVIINSYSCNNLKINNLLSMLNRFEKTGRSQVLVKLSYNTKDYGIVNCKKSKLNPNDISKIINIIEKPYIKNSIPSLSVVGRYVFSKNIWGMLEKIKPGIENEFQLTDAIKMLIKNEIVEAYCIKGSSYDCGNKLGYMKAFVKYGLYNKYFGKVFKKWLKKIL
ncbi:galU [Wigglesworthia glossinidia endosymbiont of Glossina brevipalpis]|uniref:UTP--glucose-1-phosphate uridylyltransferase n=1 Tax=Wigglesworthia glossinidia brevipalpis TaxID=36870 RepID=Q8D2I5_WIGBR|nr:galU [Wigglesworthia glossinidia endosymbiont of Glossina brevipalpis]